jgi:hypothetical protein
MRWEDAYEIKLSKNSRGESVYDIFRKGTDRMLWADIPVDKIDGFLKWVVTLSDQIVTEQMDELFSAGVDSETPDKVQ